MTEPGSGTNPVRELLLSGQKTTGAWLGLGSDATAEVLARAGFDWLLIDMEHGLGDHASLVSQLRAMAGLGSVPLVRAPWNDLVWIKRILDAGAQGVVIPYVNDRVEAEQAVAAAKGHVDSERASVADVLERLDQADEAARIAASEEREVVRVVDATRVTVEKAHQGHRAHALRSDLVVGEPCPVCEQQVAIVPDSAAPASVDQAEAAAAAARDALEVNTALARSASESLARLRAETKGAEESAAGAIAASEAAGLRREEAAGDLSAAATAVAESLGSGEPEASLAALRFGVGDAESVLEDAGSVEDTARRTFDEARDAAAEAAASLGALRTDLATLAGLLESEVAVGGGPAVLEEAVATLRTQWLDERAAAEAALAAAKEEADAARAALTDLLEAAGLGESDDVVQVIAAALAERTAKEAEVNLLEKRLTDLEQLARDEVELVESSDLLSTINSDLAPSRLLEFVLDERRRALGNLASDHLEVLSAGRYRFDESGEFLIVDLTAADAIRSPASLSGGETFLASLALALSLAEIVSREGGRLDAFFLDEGFGSLDPEHLDLAMDGIERLVTTGSQRLVVVVSHVPALRERIEDLVVLDRDPVTGDTLIVSGASAP